MQNQTKPVDPEIELLKNKLQLGTIISVLTAAVLLLGLPMWLGLPVVGVCAVAIWYGVLKMKESKQKKGDTL